MFDDEELIQKIIEKSDVTEENIDELRKIIFK